MRRLVILTLILLGSVSTCVLAAPPEKFTVGVSVWSGYPSSVEGFKAGLAEAGLIENEQIRFFSITYFLNQKCVKRCTYAPAVKQLF